MLDTADLRQCLAVLSAQYPRADPGMIEGVMRATLASMHGGLRATQTALLAEVEELAQTLANARAEIAALDAGDITASHIPSATDELDAIVAHTAAATDIILECCEKLDALGPTLSGQAGQVVQDVTTRVYEACSFQDITGQRINKIVATLQSIERKVAHIIGVFGQARLPAARPMAAESYAASLLNGPQLPEAAMDQSKIDALLASFD